MADRQNDSPYESGVIPSRPTIAAKAEGLEEVATTSLGLVGRETAVGSDPQRTLEYMYNYNPDVALAIWNYLRMVNPGFGITAYQLPDGQEVHEEATALLQRRARREYGRDYGGGLGNLINVLTLTLLTQGAAAGELEVSDDLDDVDDWCPVDPGEVQFIKTDRGGHFRPTINDAGNYYLLPPEQFRYVPLDPDVDDPYGRGMLWPCLESVFFQVEVLRDLKMVAHTAGHPRVNLSVVEEIAWNHLPAKYKQAGNEEQALSWMNGFLDDVTSEYENLKPDDALIHWDWIEADSIDAGRSSYNLSALVEVVEQQVMSALKQLPMLMGRMKGSGLAHGSVQWQVFARSVEALRQPVASLASWWATQTLRVLGIPAVAEVSFPKIRSQDRVREAQAKMLEIKAAMMEYFFGWKSNEELAEEHVGHAPVTDPDVAALLGNAMLAGSLEASETGAEEDMEEGTAEEMLGEMLKAYSGNGRQVNPLGEEDESKYFQYLPRWIRENIKRRRRWMRREAEERRGEKFEEVDNLEV